MKKWERRVLRLAEAIGLIVASAIDKEPYPKPTYDVPIPYLIACGFDPIGCEEDHLPGDCPLCGAE